MKKQKQPPIPIPEEYQELWSEWLYYKKVQHKFSYADASFEYKAFQNLLNWSNNNIEAARQIIDAAIGAGYKGFFEPRNKPQQRKVTHEQAGAVAAAFFNRNK